MQWAGRPTVISCVSKLPDWCPIPAEKSKSTSIIKPMSRTSTPPATSSVFPYGIYTIPEISMVGQNEETLTANKVPYEVGIAKYNELAKSMMLGDETGMLKLLFDRNTRKLLGVHVIGQRATEIIH